MKLAFVLAIFIFILFCCTSLASPVEITIEYPSTSCTESWSCGNWSPSTCSSGNQTRNCTDANNCGTTINKPPESQICTGNCTEDWSCTYWSNCTGGTQTRTCTDANSCGSTINKPDESQNCGCIESWTCSGWTACSNGVQTQTCTDSNNCGTTTIKPVESQSCSGQQNNGGGIYNSGGVTPPVKAGNKTITQPKPNIPPIPALKESPYVKLALSTIDEIEAGEPFTVNVTINSTMDISTTIELLGVKQDVSLNAGESKTLYFDVYAPETGGDYNLVVSTPYATGNKTILLDYKPLFLYVTPLDNQTYEIHIKNFDNASATELDVIKDNSETAYLDTLSGKIDYKVNLTFSNPGNYMVKARAMSGLSILDEDIRTFKIEGKAGIDYGLLILIVVLIIILIGSILIFKELRR
jgi:hypothetical protein